MLGKKSNWAGRPVVTMLGEILYDRREMTFAHMHSSKFALKDNDAYDRMFVTQNMQRQL